MKGKIKNLVKNKKFGFVQNLQNTKFFFHESDFLGHWNDLCEDFDKGHLIEVEFESFSTPKGMRASGVKRIDGGKVMEIENEQSEK